MDTINNCKYILESKTPIIFINYLHDFGNYDALFEVINYKINLVKNNYDVNTEDMYRFPINSKKLLRDKKKLEKIQEEYNKSKKIITEKPSQKILKMTFIESILQENNKIDLCWHSNLTAFYDDDRYLFNLKGEKKIVKRAENEILNGIKFAKYYLHSKFDKIDNVTYNKGGISTPLELYEGNYVYILFDPTMDNRTAYISYNIYILIDVRE